MRNKKNKIKKYLINHKKIIYKISFVMLFLTLILGIFVCIEIFLPIKPPSIPYNTIALNSITQQTNNLSSNSFSFAVMGDNRDGDYVLKKIIFDINNDTSFKFGLNNGDLVPDGYAKEFKNYLNMIKKSQVPIISIIGNHEIPWYDGETNYERFFGKRYFSFTYKNNYFIILDDSNEIGLDKKQQKWLVNELNKSQKFQNRFIFMHVPLYDPRVGKLKKGHSLSDLQEAKTLNNIFDKYNVSMVFASHIHAYFKGKWQKTPYIITGGAGAPLQKNGFYHFIKVSITKKGINYKLIKIKTKPLGLIDETIQSIKDTFNLN